MSVRLSGVYLVSPSQSMAVEKPSTSTASATPTTPTSSSNGNGVPANGVPLPSTPSPQPPPPQSLGGLLGGGLGGSGKVAIVAPQRSNSLDYLNFEEKRQLIASSLSLSDFLHTNGTAALGSALGGALTPTKTVSAATKVIVCEYGRGLCSFVSAPCVRGRGHRGGVRRPPHPRRDPAAPRPAASRACFRPGIIVRRGQLSPHCPPPPPPPPRTSCASGLPSGLPPSPLPAAAAGWVALVARGSPEALLLPLFLTTPRRPRTMRGVGGGTVGPGGPRWSPARHHTALSAERRGASVAVLPAGPRRQVRRLCVPCVVFSSPHALAAALPKRFYFPRPALPRLPPPRPPPTTLTCGVIGRHAPAYGAAGGARLVLSIYLCLAPVRGGGPLPVVCV
ncbi:hypothetical protein ONE63_005291 [Megalurothrips usitatus]|uniref:Uncharacterized protein n=1 Tax=Megalurothrips usitatus TaxID=439358 RepID=A0AAV7XUX6_9NEOP|nr:hypothetical protein ONE63_005291 [Megalurothrips usitatus]